MDNKAITALAREYAEIACPEFKYKGDKEWRKDDIKIETLSNEAFLTWLLRRFCLVEKSRLEKLSIFYRAKVYDMIVLNKEDVNFLFPEIAKEVEG